MFGRDGRSFPYSENGSSRAKASEGSTGAELPETSPPQVVNVDEQGEQVTMKTQPAKHNPHPLETMGGPVELPQVWAFQADDGDPSVVTETYAAENVAETPEIRYLIDPEEQFELIETVEEAGLDVVGFYHSHPTGPTHPSETDAARATWPDRSYVICALDGYPFVGSWRWRDGADEFEQETVSVRSER